MTTLPPPLEPRQAWAEVREMAHQTRIRWRHRGLAYLFWLWGAIWTVGYGALFIWSVQPHTVWLWMALWLVGLMGTAAIYARFGWRVRPTQGERERAFFWPIAALFIGLAFMVQPPTHLHPGSTRLVVLLLWAYAMLGLLVRKPFYIWWSVATALLVTAGFTLLRERWFYLWMVGVSALAWGGGGAYQRRWEGG